MKTEEKMKHFIQDHFYDFEKWESIYRDAIDCGVLLPEDQMEEWEIENRKKKFKELYFERQEELEAREHARQKELFLEHYNAPICSPQLHWNKKYLTEELEGMAPYIAIQDLVDYHYVICAIPEEETEFMMCEFKRRTVIAEYETLDELVADGWRMGN